MSRTLRRGLRIGLATVVAASLLGPLSSTSSNAALTVPQFQEQIVFSGLTKPTNIEFAPNGNVFVAEKDGVLKEFDSTSDTTPTVVADLSAEVNSQWDRGLLGIALDPGYPTTRDVYVLYTYGKPLNPALPERDDNCAVVVNGVSDPSTAVTGTSGKCVVSGRLSRLHLDDSNVMTSEDVLINDWCQQFPSHSIGDLKFGADGYLYASAGDGASFSGVADYGQLPTSAPVNPCADAPGGTLTAPTAQGGSLRAQDVRTLSAGDPTSLDGAVLRLNPATGAAAPGNPLIGSTDLNARRIIAHGLRNPFRIANRPGTGELWVGDVGWSTWEEIDRIADPVGSVTNFGWPCYEGALKQPSWDAANLNLCESLYSAGGATAPYYTYNHAADIVPGEGCVAGGDSITGLAFAPTTGGSYPAKYAGALFFADYTRQCIWAMLAPTPGAAPSPANIEKFATAVPGVTDLAINAAGELCYPDMADGTIRCVRYYAGNQPPIADIGASTTSGGAPLTVNFDGSRSTDADPSDQGRLTYAWDFGTSACTTATTVAATCTYTSNGDYTAKLTVTDTLGATASTTVVIHVGNLPTAVIDTPSTGFTWAVGDNIAFSGHAVAPGGGNLSASHLTWRVRMQHCDATIIDSCHTHYDITGGDIVGKASGSFEAPDHEYPSYLELELDAVDDAGHHSIAVRRLYPKTVTLTFVGLGANYKLTVGSVTQAVPFSRTLIQGSEVTISAPKYFPVTSASGYRVMVFGNWSDGGPMTHVIDVPATAATWSVTFNPTNIHRTKRWAVNSALRDGLRGQIPNRLGLN